MIEKILSIILGLIFSYIFYTYKSNNLVLNHNIFEKKFNIKLNDKCFRKDV